MEGGSSAVWCVGPAAAVEILDFIDGSVSGVLEFDAFAAVGKTSAVVSDDLVGIKAGMEGEEGGSVFGDDEIFCCVKR